MDDCGWLVEGLVVYGSGQLERSHLTVARDAVKAGKGPIDSPAPGPTAIATACPD
jgi:hypothetical protein